MNVVKIIGGLLDVLDSPGGHIVILLLLLAAGLHFGVMELTVGAMAVLFAIFRTTRSNHERTNGTQG